MSRLFLVFVVGVLVAGAFYLGRITAPDAPNGSVVPVSTSPATRAAATTMDSHAVVPESTESTPKGSAARVALSKLDQNPGSEQREDERLKLLTEWAMTDPTSAIQYAKMNFSHDRLPQALTAVFTSWSRKAPEAAWNWVVTNMPGEMQHLNVVIGEAGKSDPRLAVRLAQEYSKQHPEATQELLISALQGMSYTGRFEDAQNILSGLSLNSEDDRTALISYLAGQWGHYQPERVASWIESMPPGPTRDQALSNLGEAWSDANPAQAAGYAVKLPPGPARQNALRQAISKWVMTDPDQARNWVINSDLHEDFDQALVSIATDFNLVNKEPERALRWASTIIDDDLRFQSLSSVITSLYAHDPNAALNYTRTSPDLSPEQRLQLQQQLQPENTPTPPDQAPGPGNRP